LVIVEWTFTGERMDTKTVHKGKSVTVHFISAQGTMILTLTTEQAMELKRQLEKGNGNGSVTG
jgi:hypothetical protein